MIKRLLPLTLAVVTFASSRATGDEVELVVRLSDPPLAAANRPNGKRTGRMLSPRQQRAYLVQLNEKQNALLIEIASRGGRELGRVSKSLNAVIAAIEESYISELKGLPGVSTVRRVVDYQLSLDTAVPYVGASQLHTAGVDGTGIEVAVLDSGVDYTRRNLGGRGTIAAYTDACGASPGDPLAERSAADVSRRQDRERGGRHHRQ